MKKACITFLAILIIIVSLYGVFLAETKPQTATVTEYLRIHIRADSNEDDDQRVKYKVKEKVVEYLTPFISECDTKAKAETLLTERLTDIEKVADAVLSENGMAYSSKARVSKEKFPTRVYDGITLDGGIYDALIIELGSGKGDNWWCVVYPPLCFTESGAGYVYKSKIREIIKDFFNK